MIVNGNLSYSRPPYSNYSNNLSQLSPSTSCKYVSVVTYSTFAKIVQSVYLCNYK